MPRPRGYVHAIAIEIVTVDDQVAKMQADAEHDGDVLGLFPVGLGHGLLKFDGGVKCIHSAWKLDQRTVARQLDQPAAVPSQCRLQALGAMALEPGQSAVLVPAHEARVASDIRRQNSRQSTYNPLARH
jgi:hypothetical protein